MNQELNRKLAEWAGFTFKEVTFAGQVIPQWHALEYDSWEPPNFTSSLDACFKWLVPYALTRICVLYRLGFGSAYKYLFQSWIEEILRADDIDVDALALCKAIEKLIDGEGT